MVKHFNEFLKDSEEFEIFKQYVEAQIYEKDFVVNEFMIPFMNKIKEGWEFIKNLAKIVGFGLIDIAKIFLNKVVFNIFKFIGFSFTKLFSLMKDAYKTFTNFRDSLAKYLSKFPLVTKATELAGWLDGFLSNYPFLKKLAGVGIAGLLLYIWFNAISFTGDPEFDFNLQDLYNALIGKAGFVDIFGGENGIKMLTFIITNKQFGLSFAWPGSSSVQFIAAILYTLFRAIGKKFIWKPVDKAKATEPIQEI